MSMLTDYLAQALAEHVLMNTTYTSPATVYMALFTTPTDKTGGGTEVVGGSYARQAATFVDTSGEGAVGQSGDITFPAMPSCTVTHVAYFDAVSGGNMLLHGALAKKVTTTAGAPLVFEDGMIEIAFD